jgi:hypothetical protein
MQPPPSAYTLHLKVPPDDLGQLRQLVPAKYVDLPEAARAMLRRGLELERKVGSSP